MPFMRSAFADLLEPLDRRVVARVVRGHDGDHGVGGGDNAWTCRRHLTCLLFAQFAGLTSLREIVEGLGAHSAQFYHLNLRAPCRSTLSDANRDRPAAVFRDIAAALIPVAAGALRREGEALIRLLDSSPIPLKDSRFAWAEANARTRGLKLHLLYDPRHGRPVWFEVTSAKVDDVVAGRAVPLEPGAPMSSTRATPTTAGGPKSWRPGRSSSPGESAMPTAARSAKRPPRAPRTRASSPTAPSRSATAGRAAARQTRSTRSACARLSWPGPIKPSRSIS